MTRHPNILFLQVDQLAAESLSFYGNGIVQTPNLDRLAARGAVFETAYCNFPLCSPSRASMATGQLCSTIGAYDNAAELPATVPTYAHYLRDMGYVTAVSGKMHFIGPDQHHGFDSRLTPDLYPADFAWVPNWQDEGKRDTNDPQSVLVSGVAARTVQMDFDEAATYHARQFFFDRARDKSGAPWFLQVSWTHPHEPYLCTREMWDLYEGADIPLPRVPALKAAQHDAHSRRVLADFGMLDYAFSDADILRARRAHFGAITYVDRMVGEVLDALEHSGQASETVVVFCADHGEFLGERGMWFKKHFYEPSIRVPLVIAGPGIATQRVQSPASLVDLLPTFCGLAQGAPWQSTVEPLAGEDLTQFMAGGARQGAARDIAAEYLAEATTAPILMLRRGPWKYIHCRTDPPLLFDVQSDPDELNNRAGDPDVAEIEAALTAEVARRWDETRLSEDICLSQRRRRLIRDAHGKGTPPRWNHDEAPGEEVRWYRGKGGYGAWAFEYLEDSGAKAHPL